MSKLINLLLKVHDSVHLFERQMPAKKNYSEPQIYTGGGKISDWNKLTKSQQKEKLEKDWYVRYSYRHPDGKLKRLPNIKGFANSYHTKEERIDILDVLRSALLKLLKAGFNPLKPEEYTGIVDNPELIGEIDDNIITSNTKVIEAFRHIHENKQTGKSTYKELRRVINNIEKSFSQLNWIDVKISDFTHSKIKKALDNLNLTNNEYNKFLTSLSMLFIEAKEMEIIKENPVSALKKKKTVKKIRETLELEELQQIAEYLKANYYTFYRYMMIFIQSGARSSELMKVQAKDVDLKKQEYKATILKGDKYSEVKKIIINSALPYWIDLLKGVKKNDDYIFSKFLEPGSDAIQEYQITKRWKRLVKDRVGFVGGKLKLLKDIEDGIAYKTPADFYAMKHLFLDELDKSENDNKLAQILASHTSSQMTDTVYLVTKKERENEKLKKLNIQILKDKDAL